MSIKGKPIKSQELLDILSYNTNLSDTTIKRVFKYLRLAMIEELKRHGSIRLDGIGTFSVYNYGGKDKVLSFSPMKEKVYVPKQKKISFKAHDLFLDCINDERVSKVNLKRTKQYEKKFETNQMEDYEKPFEDIVEDYLKNKNKKERIDNNG